MADEDLIRGQMVGEDLGREAAVPVGMEEEESVVEEVLAEVWGVRGLEDTVLASALLRPASFVLQHYARRVQTAHQTGCCCERAVKMTSLVI